MKKLICLTLLAPCLLSGCMTTAVVAGATAGGAVIYDQRSVTTQVKDQEQRLLVLRNFHSSPELKKNSHLNASVFNGILLLTGETTNAEYRNLAVQIARQTSHFKHIYNRIEIAQPANWAQISDDTWLTTKIKAAMLSEKGLHSSQIKVISENRTVYLMGIVSRHQSDLATDVSRQIPGVQRVVKLFEYTS